MNLINTLLGPSLFWIWRSALEICIFSVLFYKTSLFLKRDRSKNLLPYFYGYCSIAALAYFIQLTTLSYFMIIFAPAAVCLFVLFHQETLQRNFVALKKMVQPQAPFADSLELLMRCMLIAMNRKQEVTVLIEHTDNVDEFVECAFKINSPLNYELLQLLLESPSIDAKKMLWITHTGTIRGINAAWHDAITARSALGATQLLTARELAEWYTGKTDCVVIELDPVARNFAVSAHGSTKAQLTSHHVLQIVKRHSMNTNNPIKLEREIHAKNKTTHSEQRTP